ncbi:MAG: response regulator with CheY-like receiver domain and winged-helix DNA-binding domain [Verrucomicrobiales bacterium]|nr:response regulator with CheY-like receiver domain and winged-helix DNA-binding domain [Verrucomicrobiales bacterium]
MSGKTILLADDEDNDALLLKRAFKKAAIAVQLMRVKDGEEAMDYLEGKGLYADRTQFPFPDLLLLDIKMPKRSGLEVLKWVREQERFKRLITVVLTSSKQAADVNQAYDLGANSYVVKPVAFQELIKLSVEMTTFWLQPSDSAASTCPPEAKRK